MKKKLSDRQKSILDYIIRHSEQFGYPPTVREIGEAVGLSSSSTVHAHLKTLENAGFIRRDAVLTRAIQVVSEEKPGKKQKSTINLPVLGTIAAGSPILASQEILDTFPVPKEMLGGGEGFMLKVKGDSMIEDGILEGDLVIIRKQAQANNGDTVAALVEDEATVKRFYKESGRIRLQPANSSMQPMYFENVKIIGKVVGVLRHLA